MGSHDRKGGFRSISESFKIVKRTGVMVGYSVGDRLTTGQNLLLQFCHARRPWRADTSAEPVHGRTSFGVSTKG